MRIFVTGTDTGVGKTYISTAYLRLAKLKGLTTLGIKPIASGAIRVNGKLVNDDALALSQASTQSLDYEKINPFCFSPPIAPHIAAAIDACKLNAASIESSIKSALSQKVDITFIEGAGGWHIPLNEDETYADFVKSIKAQVILVVGIRLGCINHAILTSQAIGETKLPFVGWVANCIQAGNSHDDMVIATLKHWLPAPLLGIVPFQVQAPEDYLVLPTL